MDNALPEVFPPDRAQRKRALDASRSILVEAPAGSGKTDLLTRRFLRVLVEVQEPGQIVAITFTKAAAAEMRHRIVAELEKAAAQGLAADPNEDHGDSDGFSMEVLARRALERSQALGWNLIELPVQLRILTIDAFCRELVLSQPLLAGLGGALEIAGQPVVLYHRAARRTLERIDSADPELRDAIGALLLWRDNNWQEMEELLAEMLSQRDRWWHGFVLERKQDWDALRERLERPFARAVRAHIVGLSALLDQAPHARDEALELARFACAQSRGALHRELAELAEFPAGPFDGAELLDEARQACLCLAELLLTNDGGFRKQADKRHGFPADCKREKSRLFQLIANLDAVAGLKATLAATRSLPPARYTDDDWRIVRACFRLLRHAAGELKVVFAEAAAVDYIEVAQIAQQTLREEDGFPGDAALAIADRIRHILVDEFQDTSRRQHELLRRLIAAWPQREGRTCFVVGDPMQSIYFFRDADAELFPRVKVKGLEILQEEEFLLDPCGLRANFRTAPVLVAELNQFFERVFAEDDGSGVVFSPAEAARADTEPIAAAPALRLHLHFDFMPQLKRVNLTSQGVNQVQEEIRKQREAAFAAQTEAIVDLIRSHAPCVERACTEGTKFRIAVLGRTRAALANLAQVLREAAIPFRAVELEKLTDRPEILDALALARALLNPYDRVAWLGVLRAPWCGLSLTDLHTLTSADNTELMARPISDLLAERADLLSREGEKAAQRVLRAITFAGAQRFAQPTTAFGTWLEQTWLRLGGAYCVDAGARDNLNLLWRCLDSLPNAEQDLLGPALDAALEDLTALPDPAADSDCGVQLMTIHKAKGLEFEVVIVPELQAQARRDAKKLLSWLERGLAAPDDSDEPTEFLVAPLQAKGVDRGKAKEWVDRVRREREKQESRRILYVAATRAREELHFFARPEYKTEADGSLALAEPRESLLATAWPALEGEIRKRFDEWRASFASSPASKQAATIDAIAASDAGNLLVMPSAAKPALVHRLPPDFEIPPDGVLASGPEGGGIIGEDAGQLYPRHEGGMLSRALGVAVHRLLQELTTLLETQPWEAAREALPQLEPRLIAQIRATGVDPPQARRMAAQAVEVAMNASRDPMGAWILSPHPDATSEARWAGVVNGSLRTVQVDRMFRAGPAPRAEGDAAWWIIDYKTAHEDGLNPEAALPELRRLFAPQIEAYAAVLRNLHGADAEIRAGLYYPRMMQFDWWSIEP